MMFSAETQVQIEVPEAAFAGDEPLVAVLRGRYVGSLHRGMLAVAAPDGQLALAIGDTRQPAFLRSAAKPFQVMPALLSGGIDRFGITERELAVLCASHNAEPRHIEAVLAVLAKIGLPEDALRCGAHPPLHEETARQRYRAGLEPTQVCNNCSGAHAAMLVACRANGWDIADYGDPTHPLQQLTREIIGAFAGVPARDVQYAIDNCAVPTFRLPLGRAARAFARLGRPAAIGNELVTAAVRVIRAMTSYPEMVAGEDRFDSDLMRAARGTIAAKGGAEGFQGMALLSTGLGLAMKVSDGNPRAVPPAVLPVLTRLGALDSAQLAELDRYREPFVHNRQDEEVGRLVPVFHPGGKT